ncbi:hypothetical protein GCM10010145_26320 [Streptomyces ruber]|uniref:Tyrosinase n=2 Tax=Streptomyces TaxID=1883 RepID=A0A918ER58_9ACTN|nr:tyrosinase cofactor [Streptomyces ruber]GGQ55326.1 hypothetical protein GCM10010145_26320 [Streptomyces ruber]
MSVSGVRRRDVARALLAAAAALVFAPAVTASRPRNAAPADDDGGFDETYGGRRIRGVPAATTVTAPARWQVTVDGRPLHLMRRADGTYLSMVDHYRSWPTALEATRAAVDEMGATQRPRAAGAPARGPGPGRRRGPGQHGGDGHGVHA